MRHLIKILLILLMPAFIANAQQKPVNLKIGDSVPSILIAKVINDTKSSFNITDFKDQLLILDFWATSCSACIIALPKMDALQKQFGNKLKILPVTYESEYIITVFMQRNKLVKNLKIPSVVEDKVLSAWFKHETWPHEVWIYKGKVIAITSGEYVDAPGIQAVLEDKKYNFPMKNDFYHYNFKEPFLNQVKKSGNTNSQSLNYVAVTGYQEGASPQGAQLYFNTEKDSLNNRYRTCFVNYSILGAYKMLWDKLIKINYILSPAVGNSGGINPNQIILEVRDKDKYIYDPDKDYRESWDSKNDISYEWISKDTVQDLKVRNQLIINDLDRLLGLKGRWEKRQVKCLELVRIDTTDRIKSKGGESLFSYKESVKVLQNTGISNLVFYLNNFAANPPVFNKTDYNHNVDLNLKFSSWTDIPAVRNALQAYGLDLKETIRELDMFVLTEIH